MKLKTFVGASLLFAVIFGGIFGAIGAWQNNPDTLGSAIGIIGFALFFGVMIAVFDD